MYGTLWTMNGSLYQFFWVQGNLIPAYGDRDGCIHKLFRAYHNETYEGFGVTQQTFRRILASMDRA